jgi:hypothetical protein
MVILWIVFLASWHRDMMFIIDISILKNVFKLALGSVFARTRLEKHADPLILFTILTLQILINKSIIITAFPLLHIACSLLKAFLARTDGFNNT